MKFYQLNYDFGDSLKYNVIKYYQHYNSAKQVLNELVDQALTQNGAIKYVCSSHGHFLNYVWVAANDHTILNVTITELSMED